VDLLGGRYRIVSPLGAGGMGQVFLADDTQLERRVAIKFLRAGSEHDQLARERLRREALAAAALDHPFICKIHEIGETDGRTFIVMEYVEGETLQAAARRGLLPIRLVVEMANEIAQALEAAHRRGVVHRDLKPSNVMMTTQGHVKVMDFGLAKQTVDEATPGSASGAATVLTGSGVRLGTPAYMSPEQVVGSTADSRSDIFALGVVLYELATGAHPFMRADAAETMTAILRDPPSAGQRPLTSVPGLDTVVGQMLTKAAADRFQTMSELRVELEALRERLWQASPSQAAPAAGPFFERTPFVAREAERTDLSRLLERTLAGQGGLALVGGEPGVGKTRLARELMREAHERACLCLTGRCFEMEGTPPFAPFIESMEEAVRLVPQSTRAALGDVAGEIAAIVPSLRRTFGDIPASPEVSADLQRRLVFGAYLEYFRRAARKTPIVLLLDDLHWADEPTLQLVGHLAPHLSSMRVLIVGTYRDVELNVRRPFAKTLEGLVRQRLAVRLSLRRLSESGVQQMLSAMGGSAPPSGLAKAVFRETEGNPFFVEEVYQHLAEEGKLFDEGGAWKPDLRVDTIEVPEGVRLVIGRRLERLGERAHKVLTAAAVLGRSFPLDVLEAIADASPDEVLDAVEEAERAQLVTGVSGTREARYEFVHELIRTTLVTDLSMPRRQRLHLKIADMLERLRASSLDSHASVLAHHLYQAGAAASTERTSKFLVLAIRRAIVAGAFEEVLDACDRLLGLEGSDDDPQLAEAYEHRGAALTGLHKPEESVTAYQRALDLYARQHDDAGVARAAGRTGLTFVFLGRFADAVATGDRALAALSSGAVRERAAVMAGLTGPALNLIPVDLAWGRLEEAAKTAEALGDPALLGGVLHAKTVAHGICGEPEAAVETGRQALALIRDELLVERADLLMNLLINSLSIGRFDDAERLAAQVRAAAQRAGLHAMIVYTDLFLFSLRHIMLNGDLRGFIGSRGTLQLPIRQANADIAAARFHVGEVAPALDMLREEVSASSASNVWKGVAAQLCAALTTANELTEARRLYPVIEQLLPVQGRRSLAGNWSALDAWVIALALAPETERLAALYPLCATYAQQIMVVPLLAVGPGHSQTVAGIAAHAAGLRDRSREHFETAVRQANELPHRLLQPTAQFWYGRMLLDDPHPAEKARGRGMIEAAIADFRSLEMVTYADLAERTLRTGTA